MEKARVGTVELEFEERGSGEPVLLLTCGPIADGFAPLLSQRPLVDRYRLIRYHRRGMQGSTRTPPPVSFAEHAADAAGLLEHLGIARAHVAGHSTGACIAMQFAADRPELVHSLTLLEAPLFRVPSTATFLANVGPALAAYGEGDPEAAMVSFLRVVCTLEWVEIQRLLEARIPGSVNRIMSDADNFFGSELPALGAWQLDGTQAAMISQPVLSVLGAGTDRLFHEGHALLHSWLPQLEDYVVADAGHLLHMQQPESVAQGLVEFLDRQETRETAVPGSRDGHASSAGLPSTVA